jgi:hypothetical protein
MIAAWIAFTGYTGGLFGGGWREAGSNSYGIILDPQNIEFTLPDCLAF